MSELDGNAEQVRLIVEQTARVVLEKIEDRLLHNLTHDDEQRIEKRIEERVDAAMNKVKLWVLMGVLAQVFVALGIAFQAGRIQPSFDEVARIGLQNRQIIEERGKWMNRRELFEQSISSWAAQHGYHPQQQGQNDDDGR